MYSYRYVLCFDLYLKAVQLMNTPHYPRILFVMISTILIISITYIANPSQAYALCGVFVSQTNADKLINEATQVVLFREGIHTSVTMRNNYKGPTEDFAMLVPVPQVLEEYQIEAVDHQLMDILMTYTSPHIVELEEAHSCDKPGPRKQAEIMSHRGGEFRTPEHGVRVLNEMQVEEYDIKILQAKRSHGLIKWLRKHKYKIPKGGKKILRGYINTGMYFIVVKINADKVKFDADGRARLTPLKFSYTSEEFSLPVRLGLLNADGPQDLLIHIISPDGRFESSNYRTGIIPTNLIVDKAIYTHFAAFYEELFTHALDTQKAQLVTEFVSTPVKQRCWPCTIPNITPVNMLIILWQFVDAAPKQKDVVSYVATHNNLIHYDSRDSKNQNARTQFDTAAQLAMNTCYGDHYKSSTAVQRGYQLCSAQHIEVQNTFRDLHWKVSCQDPTLLDEHIKTPNPTLTRCLEKALASHIVEMDLQSTDAPISKVDIQINFYADRVKSVSPSQPHRRSRKSYMDLTLTRLRARLDAEHTGEDILFRKAESTLVSSTDAPSADGTDMKSYYELGGADTSNNFQARYITTKKLEHSTYTCPKRSWFYWRKKRGTPKTPDYSSKTTLADWRSLIKNPDAKGLNFSEK